jgi:simple sugar transport system permease protein
MHDALVLATVGSISFWNSAVTVAVPIALAALGCTICSRAGILFVAVDGVMLFGGFFALAGVVWTHSIVVGVLLGVAAGSVAALVFGVLSMSMRMGDIVAGLVVHIGAIGLTGFLLARLFPNGLTIGSAGLKAIWGPVGSPALGVFLHQEPLVYLTILLAIAMSLFLRTRTGLRVRVSGESIAVAQTVGIPLVRLRFAVLAVGGALTGLGGAALGIGLVGSFDPTLVNGRGFVGLVCVILGAWRPVQAAAAAIIFALAYVLQFQLPGAAGGWAQMVPYLLTLLALVLAWGRAAGPVEEGRELPEDEAVAPSAVPATATAALEEAV